MFSFPPVGRLDECGCQLQVVSRFPGGETVAGVIAALSLFPLRWGIEMLRARGGMTYYRFAAACVLLSPTTLS